MIPTNTLLVNLPAPQDPFAKALRMAHHWADSMLAAAQQWDADGRPETNRLFALAAETYAARPRTMNLASWTVRSLAMAYEAASRGLPGSIRRDEVPQIIELRRAARLATQSGQRDSPEWVLGVVCKWLRVAEPLSG